MNPIYLYLLRSKRLFFLLIVLVAIATPAIGLSQGSPDCPADPGSWRPVAETCIDPASGVAELQAEALEAPTIPAGYQVVYLLARTERQFIEGVGAAPLFQVSIGGSYRIHALVYDPATFDPIDTELIRLKETTIPGLSGQLNSSNAPPCTALDEEGAYFSVAGCRICPVDAGEMVAVPGFCFYEGEAQLDAFVENRGNQLEGMEYVYLLSKGEEQVITGLQAGNPFYSHFTVTEPDTYRIHRFLFAPETFDLDFILVGETTIGELVDYLERFQVSICADLADGAYFDVSQVSDCPCSFSGKRKPIRVPCFQPQSGIAQLETEGVIPYRPVIPTGFAQLYLLSRGSSRTIELISHHPGSFPIVSAGQYRVHALVYDPSTLDLHFIRFGVSTIYDLYARLREGGGGHCGSLDLEGALFDIPICGCEAKSAALEVLESTCSSPFEKARLRAVVVSLPSVPAGFRHAFVLWRKREFYGYSEEPEFEVELGGDYTITSLVYDPERIDLDTFPINSYSFSHFTRPLQQFGGDLCGHISVDARAAVFEVRGCPCPTSARRLYGVGESRCLTDGEAVLTARFEQGPAAPPPYSLIYALTRGPEKIILEWGDSPVFTVTELGEYRIHPLVYHPERMDLNRVVLGETRFLEITGLITAEEIPRLYTAEERYCFSYDYRGAAFFVTRTCSCSVQAGRVDPVFQPCLDPERGSTLLLGRIAEPGAGDATPFFVLTRGEQRLIQGYSYAPRFTVDFPGEYRIHMVISETTNFELWWDWENGIPLSALYERLTDENAWYACADIDMEGALFNVTGCPCRANAGTLEANPSTCLGNQPVLLTARHQIVPNVPDFFQRLYLLASGSDLRVKALAESPSFSVSATGAYTLHTLVYNPSHVFPEDIIPGQTKIRDIEGWLLQGGGAFCGSLDTEGADFVVSECTNIDESGIPALLSRNPERPSIIRVYPNPAADIISVDFSLSETEPAGTLQLIDQFGRVLQHLDIKGNQRTVDFNLSALPPGSYSVRLISRNVVLTKAFVRLN